MQHEIHHWFSSWFLDDNRMAVQGGVKYIHHFTRTTLFRHDLLLDKKFNDISVPIHNGQ